MSNPLTKQAIETMLKTGNPNPFFDEVNDRVRSSYPEASRADIKRVSETAKGVGLQIRNVASEIITSLSQDKVKRQLDNALSELEAIRRFEAGEKPTWTTCISEELVAGYGKLDGWIGVWEFQLPQWYVKAKGLG